MTLLTVAGSRKIRLITGRDNVIELDLDTIDEALNPTPIPPGHTVVGYLVNKDVTKKLVGPFSFEQDDFEGFTWTSTLDQADFDAGVLVNPEAPDTLFVQEITRERSLCYLQVVITGPQVNEPYLIDTHLQRGFV